MKLPDFHISHAEKIEWMIETNGWALEAVSGRLDTDPPQPSLAYSIGLPALLAFPELAIFGLKPAQANGLLGVVIDAVRGGTEIPFGTELIGLFDNDLRCLFAPIVAGDAIGLFPTATAWYRGENFEIAQLIYPDPNGFMPYEAGFDRRMIHAQPIVGRLDG